nr:hypothetical protein [Tanacetum cinerariifolium]
MVLKGAPWLRKGLAKARGVTFTPRNRPRLGLKRQFGAFPGDLSLRIIFPGDLSPGKRRWGRLEEMGRLEAMGTYTDDEINRLARGDMFSQFESGGASGSGGCGDEDEGADHQDDEDEDDDGDA